MDIYAVHATCSILLSWHRSLLETQPCSLWSPLDPIQQIFDGQSYHQALLQLMGLYVIQNNQNVHISCAVGQHSETLRDLMYLNLPPSWHSLPSWGEDLTHQAATTGRNSRWKQDTHSPHPVVPRPPGIHQFCPALGFCLRRWGKGLYHIGVQALFFKLLCSSLAKNFLQLLSGQKGNNRKPVLPVHTPFWPFCLIWVVPFELGM